LALQTGICGGAEGGATVKEIIQSFRSAMQSVGIETDETILADGTLHRFHVASDRTGSKNGWYILHADDLAAGQFGCFKRGVSEIWSSKIYSNLTPGEKTRYTVRMADARRQRDVEAAKLRDDCRTWCDDRWKQSLEATIEHPYLKRKGVNAYALKLMEASLMVPLRDTDGILHGIQFISPDGSKKFKTGTRKQGCFHSIGTSIGKIYICEGYATGASIHEATCEAVAVAFDAGNLKPVAEALHQKCPEVEIIICADDDHATEGNPGLTKATEAAKAVNGKLAVPFFPDSRGPKDTDFNDLARLAGLDVVRKCIEDASLANRNLANGKGLQNESVESLNETVMRLAALLPLEYEQVRQTEAKRLNVRAGELDKAVKAARQQNTEEDDCLFPVVDEWGEPVDGRELVMELAATFERFSVLPKGSAITAALWVIETYCFDFWNTLPILAVISPEKRCGKTTFLATLGSLCHRALPVSNISPAALYRAIDAFKPSLLIDEGDTFLGNNEELRGVINSGHTKSGAYVIRCEGDNNNPVRFSTWCPKSIAMIGTPPDTIQDRSITVNLRRKLPDERIEHHGEEHDDVFRDLRSKTLRFVEDNHSSLRLAKPERLITQNDRQADNWRPLLAIAKVAGCEAEAREAALLAIGTSRDEPPAKILLLQDIRSIFEDSGETRLPSAALVKGLVELEDRPWGEWKYGKPLTSNILSRLLKPFAIYPKTIRFQTGVAKGYEFESFKDALKRYAPPDQSVTPLQINNINNLHDTKTVTGEDDVTLFNQPNHTESLECYGVTFPRDEPDVAPFPVAGDHDDGNKLISEITTVEDTTVVTEQELLAGGY
jgi:putative DNA primase/helicase